METEIHGESLTLFPQRALYWKAKNILLISDAHLGKINHFRKAGIPVPSKANDRNLEMLLELMALSNPSRVICLGDLFHSHYNPEWEVFGELVNHYKNVSFELVRGNHDVMSENQYLRKGMIIHHALVIGKFVFTHFPMETVPEGCYNLAGHVHPGVSLLGKGRQSLILPCFYFGTGLGLLPAFGVFTGLARIAPKKEDKIYVIADNKVIFVS